MWCMHKRTDTLIYRYFKAKYILLTSLKKTPLGPFIIWNFQQIYWVWKSKWKPNQQTSLNHKFTCYKLLQNGHMKASSLLSLKKKKKGSWHSQLFYNSHRRHPNRDASLICNRFGAEGDFRTEVKQLNLTFFAPSGWAMHSYKPHYDVISSAKAFVNCCSADMTAGLIDA